MPDDDAVEVKRRARVWLINAIAVGFALPLTLNLAYWSALNFFPQIVIAPYGGFGSDVGAGEFNLTLSFVALSGLAFGILHSPIFVSFGVCAWLFLRNSQPSSRARFWAVRGAAVGLGISYIFFLWAEGAPYVWGSTFDTYSTGMLLISGIIGLLPALLASAIGGGLAYGLHLIAGYAKRFKF